MKFKKKYVFFLVLFSSASISVDLAYVPTDGLNLTLGYGFDPNDPFTTKEDCLTFNTGFPEGDGVKELKVDLKLVEKTSELIDEFDLTLSSAYGYKAVGAKWDVKASLGIDKDLSIKRDELALVLSVNYVFQNKKVTNPRTRNELKDLSEIEFKKRCGTHFAAYESRNAHFYAISKLKNVTESMKKRIKQSFDFSYKGGSHSGSINAKIEKFHSLSRSLGTLDLEVHAVGGLASGIKTRPLSKVWEKRDIDGFFEFIDNYIANISNQNSNPDLVYVAEYLDSPLHAYKFNPELLNFSNEAFRLNLDLNQMESMLRDEMKSLRSKGLISKSHKSIVNRQKVLNSINGRRFEIQSLLDACIKEGKCDKRLLEYTKLDVPWLGAVIKQHNQVAYCMYTNGLLNLVRVKLNMKLDEIDLVNDISFYIYDENDDLRKIQIDGSEIAFDKKTGRITVFIGRYQPTYPDFRKTLMNERVALEFLDLVSEVDYSVKIRFANGEDRYFDLGYAMIDRLNCSVFSD
jgi:hypothetical protein